MQISKTILIGGDIAKRTAQRIGEFDYFINQPLSVAGFVNPTATEHFTLVNYGQKWHDLPIYPDLFHLDPEINSVGIYFNAKHVLYWVQEITKYSQIKNIVIFAEDVPEKDAREIIALAKKYGLNIVGPSSTGILFPGKGRLGEIGGDWRNLNLCRLDTPGPVGIITKSGTMSGEMLWVVSQNSPGISMAVHIGGDRFPATDFTYWLNQFAADTKTKVVVLSGEAGGDLEEQAAAWYKKAKPHYKLVAVVSGLFLEQMPKGQKFGHAGAMQEASGYGSARHKIAALREAGAIVVEFESLSKTIHELTT